MQALSRLFKHYKNLHKFSRGIVFLLALLLAFYALNVIILLNNKPQDAYTALSTENEMLESKQ